MPRSSTFHCYSCFPWLSKGKVRCSALIFLSGTLALAGVGCSSDRVTLNRDDAQPSATLPTPYVALAVPESPAPPATLELEEAKPNSIQPNPYELGLDKAQAAFSISQSAQSSEDWKLVASQWLEAIAQMKAVPANSSYKTIAQNKITQYQRNFIYAQHQANLPVKDEPDNVITIEPESPLASVAASSPAASDAPPAELLSQSVWQVPIKRRAGGTPVIEVTFNGSHKTEMIVDTGASGTVITQQTADALGVVPVAKAKANTASAKGVEFSVGYIKSIEVAGAKSNDLPVAIAGPELETGLLGHDFFGNYDITIKRDVIEFHPR